MQFFIIVVQLFSLLSVVNGFMTSTQRQSRSLSLSMKVATPSVGNIARKLKRKIRSVDATNFDTLYTPEFDVYLKTEATAGIYETIRKNLTKKARELKVTIKSDFGLKPKIVLPTIVETAVKAGTFQVSTKLIL